VEEEEYKEEMHFHEDAFEVDNESIFDTHQPEEEFVFGVEDENVMKLLQMMIQFSICIH